MGGASPLFNLTLFLGVLNRAWPEDETSLAHLQDRVTRSGSGGSTQAVPSGTLKSVQPVLVSWCHSYGAPVRSIYAC